MNDRVSEKPFRYFENENATKSLGRTDYVSFRVDHGVLVATILANSLIHEKLLRDLEDQVRKHLPEAEKALLLDCSRVTLGVSSQFLGVMMLLRKALEPSGSVLAVCGLTGSFAEAFEVANFGKVVRVFDNVKNAVVALGEFTQWEQARIDSVQQYEQACKPAQAAWQERLRMRHLPAAGLATTALVVCLAIGAIGYFSWSSPSQGATSAVESKWLMAPKIPLHGTISLATRGVTVNAPGTAVVAWPASDIPDDKHPLTFAALLNSQSSSLTAKGPFVTQADSHGNYAINLPVPDAACDYYLLFVLVGSHRQGQISADDRAVLAVYFSDPDRMIGDSRYHLMRRTVAAASAIDPVDWRFR